MIRIISRFNQADLGTVSQRSVLFTHSTHWQLPCIHLRSRRETVFWYPYLKHQRNAYEGNFHVTINVTKSSQLVRKHVFSQKMKPSRGAGRHCTICLKEIEAGELPSVQLGQHCVMAYPCRGQRPEITPGTAPTALTLPHHMDSFAISLALFCRLETSCKTFDPSAPHLRAADKSDGFSW